MTECSFCDDLTSNVGSVDLEKLRQDCTVLIQKHLFPDAELANPSETVSIRLSYPNLHDYILKPTEIVLELEKLDLDNLLHRDNANVKGCYVPELGKLFLVRSNWCLETIIHETLHSCSRPSTYFQLYKYDRLYEGLTEFFTGYILYKEFCDCYDDCFTTSGRLCQMTYTDHVKLWAGFCNFVSLKNLIGLYFPTTSSWEQEVENFVNSVQALGFERFSSPFTSGGLPSDVKFEIICTETFGIDFHNICKDSLLYSDFSKVLDN